MKVKGARAEVAAALTAFERHLQVDLGLTLEEWEARVWQEVGYFPPEVRAILTGSVMDEWEPYQQTFFALRRLTRRQQNLLLELTLASALKRRLEQLKDRAA